MAAKVADFPASNNLPAQLTSFVGRQPELVQIEQLLTSKQTRLLTLTGPGGSGKTRLALEAARQLQARFKEGVWLVELAVLANPQLVSQSVAQILQLQEQPKLPLLATVISFLKDKAGLLILDNCEHLLEACARMSQKLLQECPNLVILSTSRESLRIEGESLLAVAPLQLPDASKLTRLTLGELAHSEAIQLFVQRSRAVQPGFALSEQNRTAVLDLCRSLDGLPLALELAAARLRGLSVVQLASRFENGLGAGLQLLNQGSRTALPRHQTLEALLDWSYTRLPEREQVLLRRLAVFKGSFSLSGAQAVCQGSFVTASGQGRIEASQVLDLLAELANKSLLQLDESAAHQTEPRYRLLETIRQYSLEKAEQADELFWLYQQHLTWCIALAEEAEPHLQGPEQREWLTHLEREYPNLRAGLEWAWANSLTEQALRLSGALWRFWQLHSHFEEGRYWLEKILGQSSLHLVKSEIRAKALQGAGVLFSLWDYPSSLIYHEENLRLRREQGDQQGLMTAQKDLGWLALHHNDFDRAKDFATASLELARSLQDKAGVAAALFIVVIVASFSSSPDELEQASRWCDECLELWRQLGDAGSVASGLHQAGTLALHAGDFAKARQSLLDSLNLNWQLDNKIGVANNIITLIELGIAQPEQPSGLYYAVTLLGWLISFDVALGGKMPPLARQSVETSLGAGRNRLPETTFDQLWEEGRQFSLEQAFQRAQAGGLATSQADFDQPQATSTGSQLPLFQQLTQRENEVLSLVVEGLTNAQIAERLSVTPRTVNAHLTSIYSKLGVSSRASAISYALKNRLV